MGKWVCLEQGKHIGCNRVSQSLENTHTQLRQLDTTKGQSERVCLRDFKPLGQATYKPYYQMAASVCVKFFC